MEQKYQLAQINVSKMLAPIDDPVMAEFVAKLDEINAIADKMPGFVWRLQSETGNATDIKAFEDELIIVNLSVWESIETLSDYVYRTQHSQVMRSRNSWFEKSDRPNLALWWILVGEIPTVKEGKKRLEYLQQKGSTPKAFSFAKPFPPQIADLKI